MKDENKYNPGLIEKKWQEVWEKEKTFSPDLNNAKNPYYNLMMFPYPSAEGLHVGNMYAFAGADVYARFNRMQGKDVFEPIGLDGFGIHSENYALKVGRHPMEQAEISEKNFYRQMHSIGNSFDWQRTVQTYDPEYYRWTQWLFIQMFKAGLSYRAKATVNWCPSCKTVLSDEQVIDTKCERCSTVVEKKDLEQWFFRITKYAQKLLDNLENLDWTEKVKTAQRNWIGRSEGAVIEFQVVEKERKINPSEIRVKVFTTRPDTLFGATFLVVSPEHPLVKDLDQKTITDYVKMAKSKSDKERMAEGKEKTGVFSGLYAINPVNNEKIPIWIADYVLTGYGTGAIMAVPAHDDRDFAFAKKYNIPIKQVIMPENGIKREDEERRDGGAGIIFDPKRQKYAVPLWPERNNFLGLFAGGVEDEEDEEEGVLREITEESGLHNFKHVEKIGDAFAHYYSGGRKVNRVAKASGYLIILENDEVKETHLEDHEKFTLVWKDPEEIFQNWKEYDKEHGLDHWVRFLHDGVARAIELGHDTTNNKDDFKLEPYIGNGIIINSGEWNDWRMPEEMDKVLDWLADKGIGKREVSYHLRDWLISRQRYWGPPIPMIFCPTCEQKGKGEREEMPGWYAVPEEHLPVRLPKIDDYKPLGTGKSPLGSHEEFYKTKCPSCHSEATRETDVSDTFLDSAWYFFRYTSTDVESAPFDTERVKKWLPVEVYIGGAEHSVLHLLYSRFVTSVLKDLNFINFDEPFSKFFAHGLIIKDGAKMSKSKGNVVVPDEYIGKYGADTLRLYLMFLGPFSQGGDFRDSGIEGMNRFVRRVWKLLSSDSVNEAMDAESLKIMHKTIKEVTEDIRDFKYNTAIAHLMEWYNFLVDKKVTHEEIEVYLKLLAPFASHLAEEIWHELGNKTSIHLANWPTFDPKYLVEDRVTVIVQVNGKKRGEVTVESSQISNQASLEEAARGEASNHLQGKEIRKVVYIPGKIINFVVS